MIVTKIKLVRLTKYLHLHIFVMLKNGSVLYFDRVFFVIFNLGGALFVTCNSDQ